MTAPGYDFSWRAKARRVIARVLEETRGQSDYAIRTALHNAYPFGDTKLSPYAIWCDEVRKQRGQAATKPARKRGAPPPVDPRQLALFDDKGGHKP